MVAHLDSITTKDLGALLLSLRVTTRPEDNNGIKVLTLMAMEASNGTHSKDRSGNLRVKQNFISAVLLWQLGQHHRSDGEPLH
jgi:hypothetical protein